MIHLKKHGINWIPPVRKGSVTRGMPWHWSMCIQNKQRVPRVHFHVIRDITHKNKWDNTRKRKPHYSASAVAMKQWDENIAEFRTKFWDKIIEGLPFIKWPDETDEAYKIRIQKMVDTQEVSPEDYYAANVIGGIPVD